MKTKSVLSAGLKGRCPQCRQGEMFTHGPFVLSKMTSMHRTCSKCGLQFEVEPGFFFGAMYVSYALGIAQAIAVFIVGTFFFENTFDLRILPWIVATVLLLSSFNTRLSRIIWIYLLKGI